VQRALSQEVPGFFVAGASNLLQAFPFAIAHLGETYSSEILFFFVIVLLLGLGLEHQLRKLTVYGVNSVSCFIGLCHFLAVFFWRNRVFFQES